MSLPADAQAILFIADYANADAAGKINALGAGFKVTGIGPNGLTPPLTLVVLIDVPAKYAGTEFPVSVDLRRDDTGELMQQQGPSGHPEAMRIQQMVKADAPHSPGVYLPSSLGPRVQLVYGFPAGLGLPQGVTYRWNLEIDGQSRPGWQAHFHVAGPPPGPVLGGPAGPADFTIPFA